MTVYVDDMYNSSMGVLGRMKMSHMQADTLAELHNMADAIGVNRRWFQGDHYDIAMSKRELAIQKGAVAVTMKELGYMRLVRRERSMDSFPDPKTARQLYCEMKGLPYEYSGKKE